MSMHIIYQFSYCWLLNDMMYGSWGFRYSFILAANTRGGIILQQIRQKTYQMEKGELFVIWFYTEDTTYNWFRGDNIYSSQKLWSI